MAVNPTDLTFRAGDRAEQVAGTNPPYVPGVDVAGVMNELGPGTSGRLSAGDRVIALAVPMGPRGGTYAEEIVTAESSVVRAPKNATDAEAATLLINGAAARLALDTLGLERGQAVAITGAAGAVGGYAIQLAKARGLVVIADAPPHGAGLVRDLGADHIVDRGDGYSDQVRALVPGGVPGLIDGVNLDAAALGAIADGGAIVSVKGWRGPAERDITVRPISAFKAVTDTALLGELRDLAEDGVLTLRVAEVLPARLAAQAHRRLAAGGTTGWIVLDLQDPLT